MMGVVLNNFSSEMVGAEIFTTRDVQNSTGTFS
jgi:hypothetical protein